MVVLRTAGSHISRRYHRQKTIRTTKEINTELKRISCEVYHWKMMRNPNIAKGREEVNFLKNCSSRAQWLSEKKIDFHQDQKFHFKKHRYEKSLKYKQ